MDFEQFLPKTEEEEAQKKDDTTSVVGQNQVYDIITSRQPDWQSIIYDLVSSEQLNPWDIDISLLTQKYFEKIEELEEMDFYISSKVLLAAAILLRFKTDFLLNKSLKDIDNVLFGRTDEEGYKPERIEIDTSELPLLIPKTPMPRAKKVTLPQLMEALNKAINTESRRIKREVAIKRAQKLSNLAIPTEIKKRGELKNRIREFYARVRTAINKTKEQNKVGFLETMGKEKEEKLASFLPLLHLSNSQKLWLQQDNHLDEVHIYLYDYFNKNRHEFITDIEHDNEDEPEEELVAEEKVLTGLEKAAANRKKKKEMELAIKRELEEELGITTSETPGE